MKNSLLVLCVVLVTGCAPAPAPTPDMNAPVSSADTPLPPPTSFAPENAARGAVFLDEADLLTMESFPLQFSLTLRGNLPTPCHTLQTEITPPDAQNKIVVEVYSTSNPEEICAQALQPFEEHVPLGSFPAGHYFLWVNGELAAEFDA